MKILGFVCVCLGLIGCIDGVALLVALFAGWQWNETFATKEVGLYLLIIGFFLLGAGTYLMHIDERRKHK